MLVVTGEKVKMRKCFFPVVLWSEAPKGTTKGPINV